MMITKRIKKNLVIFASLALACQLPLLAMEEPIGREQRKSWGEEEIREVHPSYPDQAAELINAIIGGNNEMVKSLIANDEILNAPLVFYHDNQVTKSASPLALAIYFSHPKLALMLIEMGASPLTFYEKKEANGTIKTISPLWLAADRSYGEVVEKLLSKGVSPDQGYSIITEYAQEAVGPNSPLEVAHYRQMENALIINLLSQQLPRSPQLPSARPLPATQESKRVAHYPVQKPKKKSSISRLQTAAFKEEEKNLVQAILDNDISTVDYLINQHPARINHLLTLDKKQSAQLQSPWKTAILPPIDDMVKTVYEQHRKPEKSSQQVAPDIHAMSPEKSSEWLEQATPLFIALLANNYEMANYLLGKSQDPSKEFKIDFEQGYFLRASIKPSHYSVEITQTPLYYAVNTSKIGLIKELLGQQVKPQDVCYSFTLFKEAGNMKKQELVTGITALDLAEEKEFFQIKKLLEQPNR